MNEIEKITIVDGLKNKYADFRHIIDPKLIINDLVAISSELEEAKISDIIELFKKIIDVLPNRSLVYYKLSLTGILTTIYDCLTDFKLDEWYNKKNDIHKTNNQFL